MLSCFALRGTTNLGRGLRGGMPGPFHGDAASSRVVQGGPSLRDGHSQLSHRIKKSGAREKSEWEMTF